MDKRMSIQDALDLIPDGAGAVSYTHLYKVLFNRFVFYRASDHQRSLQNRKLL